MRYTPDVINAERWNTGIKKSSPHKASCDDEMTINQKSSMPRTGKRKRVSDTDLIRTIKPDTPSATALISKQRIRRRKKRDMLLLSGLLTGLSGRFRKHK